MTTEEIVNAVRDAGFSSSDMFLRLPAFKHLIDSAAAAEREACAQLAENMNKRYAVPFAALHQCADAIRARSQK